MRQTLHAAAAVAVGPARALAVQAQDQNVPLQVGGRDANRLHALV
jgi:hypothetical protein